MKMTEQEYRARMREIRHESRVWEALLYGIDMLRRAEQMTTEHEAKGNKKLARAWQKEFRMLDVLIHAAMASMRKSNGMSKP